MSFADDVRADLMALVNERGVLILLGSETVTGSGPRPTFQSQVTGFMGVRQNNVRRFSPWQSEEGDVLITAAVGPYPGLLARPERGFFVRFYENITAELTPGNTSSGYGPRYNVIQSRDRTFDTEPVAYTMLVRRATQ